MNRPERHRRRRSRVLAALAVVFLCGAPAAHGAGKRTETPVPSGTAAIEYREKSVGRALEIQPDGRILVGGDVGGRRSDTALSRLMPSGQPDRSFHRVTSSPGARAGVADLALLSDGRILVAGDVSRRTRRPNYRFMVSRYTSRGKVDRSFGVGGFVKLAFGQSASALEVIVQPDGKLVVGGVVSRGRDHGFALARLLPDGALDPTFGNLGLTETFLATGRVAMTDMHLFPDGSIQLVGHHRPRLVADVGIARYTPAGVLDQAFGSGGTKLVYTPAGDPNDPLKGPSPWGFTDTRFTPSGSMISVTEAPSETNFAGMGLARMLPDGSLDPSFGNAGRSVVHGPGPFIGTLHAFDDGSAVILGTGDGPMLTRVGTNGALQRSFGRRGLAAAGFRRGMDISYTIAVDPTGSIFITGGYSAHSLITAHAEVTFVTKFGSAGRVKKGFG